MNIICARVCYYNYYQYTKKRKKLLKGNVLPDICSKAVLNYNINFFFKCRRKVQYRNSLKILYCMISFRTLKQRRRRNRIGGAEEEEIFLIIFTLRILYLYACAFLYKHSYLFVKFRYKQIHECPSLLTVQQLLYYGKYNNDDNLLIREHVV